MALDQAVIDTILKATEASEVTHVELIQNLWNNYGQLLRIHLSGSNSSSVILKHAKVPVQQNHPRGFGSSLSQQRKIKSYQVETTWYEKYNSKNHSDNKSLTAQCLDAFQKEGEFFILLEDLKQSGLTETPSNVSFETIKVVLTWLANFHAKFLNSSSEGLWQVGTYWHLSTRPDELNQLDDQNLKELAPLLDSKLTNCRYKTLVHGDAKLANFCFDKSLSRTAAVDFQYVGGGCGMKDVAYFIGSCMDEDSCEKLESQILDYYFAELSNALSHSVVDKKELIDEWRPLYHIAWADFHRFLKGWSPGHWKINSYSERVTSKACLEVLNEISESALIAAKEAGKLIMSFYQKDFQRSSKEGQSEAASIVTEVDLKSQDLILKNLQNSIKNYDLGVLAEESDNDKSRLEKAFYWAIDPIDGTLFFSEGKPGFAVSIALISKAGNPYIGVVLDPVKDELFCAVKNSGSTLNGKDFQVNLNKSDKPTLYADRSLEKQTNYNELSRKYNIQFSGGAVLNALNAVRNPNSFYIKEPRNHEGGCTVWDIAATVLIVTEAGGSYLDFNKKKLNLNKKATIYYNEEGLYVSSSI